jgi:hypothetical protein
MGLFFKSSNVFILSLCFEAVGKGVAYLPEVYSWYILRRKRFHAVFRTNIVPNRNFTIKETLDISGFHMEAIPRKSLRLRSRFKKGCQNPRQTGQQNFCNHAHIKSELHYVILHADSWTYKLCYFVCVTTGSSWRLFLKALMFLFSNCMLHYKRLALYRMTRLIDTVKCKVCLHNPVHTVFIPCGHVICGKCLPELTVCHICRQEILNLNSLFLVWTQNWVSFLTSHHNSWQYTILIFLVLYQPPNYLIPVICHQTIHILNNRKKSNTTIMFWLYCQIPHLYKIYGMNIQIHSDSLRYIYAAFLTP